jgi:hypothetical protein
MMTLRLLGRLFGPNFTSNISPSTAAANCSFFDFMWSESSSSRTTIPSAVNESIFVVIGIVLVGKYGRSLMCFEETRR